MKYSFSLYRFLLSYIAIITFGVQGQYLRKDSKGYEIFLEKHDKKKIHFGITFAALRDNLRVHYSVAFFESDSIQMIKPSYAGGATGSILVNYVFDNRFLSLKFVPGVSLHFWRSTVTYRNQSEDIIDFNNTQIELPLYFKYRSVRRRNHNLYLLGGLTMNITVGRTNIFEDFSLKRQFVEISYGIGWTMYTRYTRFAPEFRFSHGILNLAQHNDSFLSSQINSIFNHRIGFYLNFGG